MCFAGGQNDPSGGTEHIGGELRRDVRTPCSGEVTPQSQGCVPEASEARAWCATGKGNIMCGDQSDHVLQHWTIDISIDEHEGLTHEEHSCVNGKRLTAQQGSIRPRPRVPRSAMNSQSLTLSDLGSEC